MAKGWKLSTSIISQKKTEIMLFLQLCISPFKWQSNYSRGHLSIYKNTNIYGIGASIPHCVLKLKTRKIVGMKNKKNNKRKLQHNKHFMIHKNHHPGAGTGTGTGGCNRASLH